MYAKRDVVIVRGKGAVLYDDQGRAYIDCVGGQGAANLGHAHPAIAEAIAAQALQLVTCPEMFYNDRRAELMARLAQVAPPAMAHIFLCNSGTESIEAAIKFARLSTGRRGIVAAMVAFMANARFRTQAVPPVWPPSLRNASAAGLHRSSARPSTRNDGDGNADGAHD